MPYILIEPANRQSFRNVQRILNLLRGHRNIREHTIFDIEVNGYDEWTVEVSANNEDVDVDDIELLLKMNQELIKKYEVRDEKWIR